MAFFPFTLVKQSFTICKETVRVELEHVGLQMSF